MKVWQQCYFVKTASILCMSKHGIAALEIFEYGLLDSSHPAEVRWSIQISVLSG